MLGKINLKIFVVAFVIILLTLSSFTTLTYYQTAGKTTNVVTSGGIKFKIHETTADGTEFAREGVNIVPGDIVSKKVNIESNCGHPFYLRVKIIYDVDSKEVAANDCFKLDFNQKDWVLNDGWYYYKDAVNPKEITSELFSQVEIVGGKVDNEYLGKTLTLTVNAQAVQCENNPIVDGNIYTASGWPKE